MSLLLNEADFEREFEDSPPIPAQPIDEEAIYASLREVAALLGELALKLETKPTDAISLRAVLAAISAGNQVLAAQITTLLKQKRQWDFKVKYDDYGDVDRVIAKEL